METIRSLTQDVEILQTRLAEMRGDTQAMVQQQRERAHELRETLREGMRGEAVEQLQAILAADPALYPEGLVTGFFGPLTRNALVRLQQRSDIAVTGELDETTRELLNQRLAEATGVASALDRVESADAEQARHALAEAQQAMNHMRQATRQPTADVDITTLWRDLAQAENTYTEAVTAYEGGSFSRSASLSREIRVISTGEGASASSPGTGVGSVIRSTPGSGTVVESFEVSF